MVPCTASGTLVVAGRTVAVRSWDPPDPASALPMLAIHQLGIAGSALHFGEIAPLLAGSYGVRVLAVDLPGFGGSPAAVEPDDYRPDRLALFLVGVLDRLGVARATVLGSSYGATIAAHLAAAAPSRVGGLVLLDGGFVDAGDVPGFDLTADLDARIDAAARRFRQFRFRRLDGALERVAGDYPRWTPELAEAWRAAFRQAADGRFAPRLRPDVYAAAVHGLAAAPPSAVWPTLAAAGMPVFLVTADPDAATPAGAAVHAARGRFAAAVPSADVEVAIGQGPDLVAALGPVLAERVGGWLVQHGLARHGV